MYRSDGHRLTLSGVRDARQVAGLSAFLSQVTTAPRGFSSGHRSALHAASCQPSNPFQATREPRTAGRDVSGETNTDEIEDANGYTLHASSSAALPPSSRVAEAKSSSCDAVAFADAEGSSGSDDKRSQSHVDTRGVLNKSRSAPALSSEGVSLSEKEEEGQKEERQGSAALASVYLDDAPAEVVVAALEELRSFPRLQILHVHLWGLDWTPEMIKLLGQVFAASAATLESVALRCRVSAPVLTEMLERLPTNVRYLDVSENMLGGDTTVVPVLETLLRRNAIESLKVSQVGWSRESKELFAKAVENLGVFNCLQWLEGVDLSEWLAIPPQVFMQAAVPVPPCSSVAATTAPLAHLYGHRYGISGSPGASRAAAAALAKSLPATTVNYTLLRYLRIRTFLPMLVGKKVRVWWKPTCETQRTDFSGRYWPARVVHGCTDTLVCKLVYDNNEQDFISLRYLQPYHPFKYGGGWGCLTDSSPSSSSSSSVSSSSSSSQPCKSFDMPAEPGGVSVAETSRCEARVGRGASRGLRRSVAAASRDTSALSSSASERPSIVSEASPVVSPRRGRRQRRQGGAAQGAGPEVEETGEGEEGDTVDTGPFETSERVSEGISTRGRRRRLPRGKTFLSVKSPPQEEETGDQTQRRKRCRSAGSGGTEAQQSAEGNSEADCFLPPSEKGLLQRASSLGRQASRLSPPAPARRSVELKAPFGCGRRVSPRLQLLAQGRRMGDGSLQSRRAQECEELEEGGRPVGCGNTAASPLRRMRTVRGREGTGASQERDDAETGDSETGVKREAQKGMVETARAGPGEFQREEGREVWGEDRAESVCLESTGTGRGRRRRPREKSSQAGVKEGGRDARQRAGSRGSDDRCGRREAAEVTGLGDSLERSVGVLASAKRRMTREGLAAHVCSSRRGGAGEETLVRAKTGATRGDKDEAARREEAGERLQKHRRQRGDCLSPGTHELRDQETRDEELRAQGTGEQRSKSDGDTLDVAWDVCCGPAPVSRQEVAAAASFYPYLFEQSLYTFLLSPERDRGAEENSERKRAAGREIGEETKARGAHGESFAPAASDSPGRDANAGTSSRPGSRALGTHVKTQETRKAGEDTETAEREKRGEAQEKGEKEENEAVFESLEDASVNCEEGRVRVGRMPLAVIGNVLLPGELCEFRDEEEHRGSDPSDFVGMVVAVNSEEPLYVVRCVYHDDDTLLQIHSSDIRRAVVVPLDAWIAWRFALERHRLRSEESSSTDSAERGASRAPRKKREGPPVSAARRGRTQKLGATGCELQGQGPSAERRTESRSLLNLGSGQKRETKLPDATSFPSFREVPPFAAFYMLPIATSARLHQMAAAGRPSQPQRSPVDLKLLPAQDFAEDFAVRQVTFVRGRQEALRTEREAGGVSLEETEGGTEDAAPLTHALQCGGEPRTNVSVALHREWGQAQAEKVGRMWTAVKDESAKATRTRKAESEEKAAAAEAETAAYASAGLAVSRQCAPHKGFGPRSCPLAAQRNKAVRPLVTFLALSASLGSEFVKQQLHPRIQQSDRRAWLALLPKTDLLQKVIDLSRELATLKVQVQREAAILEECQRLRVGLEKQKEREGELESLLKCIICVSRTRSVALAPCLHFYFCRACSQGLTQCPICRGKILSRIHVKREQGADEESDAEST
ncbi:UNVERIFIED_CONTAM: hypothetical protein HHA_219640 [Hammondia hammondi]|eukprot:XP_008889434.1 hypothetical protein HHA_219640 [Hammondia hammondi]